MWHTYSACLVCLYFIYLMTLCELHRSHAVLMADWKLPNTRQNGQTLVCLISVTEEIFILQSPSSMPLPLQYPSRLFPQSDQFYLKSCIFTLEMSLVTNIASVYAHEIHACFSQKRCDDIKRSELYTVSYYLKLSTDPHIRYVFPCPKTVTIRVLCFRIWRHLCTFPCHPLTTASPTALNPFLSITSLSVNIFGSDKTSSRLLLNLTSGLTCS
jgi:hypothetical protein